MMTIPIHHICPICNERVPEYAVCLSCRALNGRAHAAELLATGQISSFFEIVDASGNNTAAGYDGNAFPTRTDAEGAIVELRELGEDWADVAWSVREVTR